MNLKEQLDSLLDATAFDSTGTKVGTVRQVYVDDASGKITFATVSTGVFSADAIVPLHGARLLDDELHVDHTRAVIRDSPRPENTEDTLTAEQEVRLLEHYGLEAPERGRDAAAAPRRPKSEPEPGPTADGAKSTSVGPSRLRDSGAGDTDSPDAGSKRHEKPGTTDARGGTTSSSHGSESGTPGARKAEAAPSEPATAEPGASATAEPGPSPTTPPAGSARTGPQRPGPTRPATATTSENGTKDSSPDRD